jgi:hypothetical protein
MGLRLPAEGQQLCGWVAVSQQPFVGCHNDCGEQQRLATKVVRRQALAHRLPNRTRKPPSNLRKVVLGRTTKRPDQSSCGTRQC